MAATRGDIETWFDRGVAEGKTHMAVMMDTHDYEDYPIFASPDQNIRVMVGNGDRLMEVYDLSMDKVSQLGEHRAMHWPEEKKPMRYVSKPSVIEAVQWTGDNFEELQRFAARNVDLLDGDLFLLAGSKGENKWVPVPVGSWVVRSDGDPSDYWPVNPEYFANKYMPAENIVGADEEG